MDSVKKVHVIYKTHLDIGFTALSKDVVNNYIENFIPKAIQLAKEVNAESQTGGKVFVWTVGSWLIYEYLRTKGADEAAELINAIERGDICWHALPFTTHSELMSEKLFEFGLSLSKKLDARFGIQTTAAKMTDVPGHTRGIVSHLSNNGVKYLHIGINSVAHIPQLPHTFVWRDSRGNEIIVDYSQGYGKETVVDGFDEIMAFAHSDDNCGPPSKEEILKNIENLKEKYPGAEIFASNLNDYAKALEAHRDKLPLVTSEIGDTWIHGVGSDPYKVSIFKNLLMLSDKWLKTNELAVDDLHEFFYQLLMIPEHTWGLDSKKYLPDYANWDKANFIKARKADKLTEDCGRDFPDIYEFGKLEFEKMHIGMKWEDMSYSYFESSHEEQRQYLNAAVGSLPAKQRQEAQKLMYDLKNFDLENSQWGFDSFTEVSAENATLNSFHLGRILTPDKEPIKIEFKDDGALILHRSGHKFRLGFLSYQLFGAEQFENYKAAYMHEYEKNYVWAAPDNFKIGMELSGADAKNHIFRPKLNRVFKGEISVVAEMIFPEVAYEKHGCPRKAYVRYNFIGNEVFVLVNMLNKDASRMPEALWVSFFENAEISNVNCKILGEDINPMDVVMYGNKNYHCVDSVAFSHENTEIKITPIDTPLLCIGERRLMDFNQNYADAKDGLHFNLFNNLWNTNFKMWYEENIIARFKINIAIK